VEVKCKRGIRIMSWAFFGLFAGFGAAQSLQSTLNKASLGFINLGCLYFMFCVVGLLCPRVIQPVIEKFGWRSVFICAGMTYIVMIASNLDTADSGIVVQPIANALLGVGAAFLWTTQNVYFGQAAYIVGTSRSAMVSSQHASSQEAITALATQFNSIFFGVFQFANSTGNLLASALMLAFKGIAWLRYLLICVLATAATCGAAVFLLLPSIEHSRESQDQEAPSVVAALKAVGDVRFAALLPWIITNGMTFALVNGDYTADVVAPLLGNSYVGFLMTVFFAVDAFFSMFWGRLITQRVLSRRTVFCCTSLLWIAFLLVKLLWTRRANYKKEGTEWQQVHDPTWLDVALPLTLAVIAGAADGFWTPGPPSVTQSFFADSDNLVATQAAYKAFQSLGFAIQFTIGATLQAYPELRSSICLCCVVGSVVSVLCLDLCKQPLDPRVSSLTTALNSDQAEAGKESSCAVDDARA